MDNRNNAQNQVNCMKDSMVGCKYRHFKGGMYEVTDIAVHSETEEPMVIYYSCDHPDYVWCRPLSIFLSEVDHEKYPDIKQHYRFAKTDDRIS